MQLVLCSECRELLVDGGFDVKQASKQGKRDKCSNCGKSSFDCKVFIVESSRKAHAS